MLGEWPSWSMAADCKSARVKRSWVRILPLPPFFNTIMRNCLLFLFGLFALFSISSCHPMSSGLMYQYIDEDDEIEENAYNICYEYGKMSSQCKEALAKMG